MKRFTLFFAMASLLWCLAAWAEEPEDYEYVPLVREGIEWTYFVSYYSTDIEPYYFHMQFYGDTVVDGITYKKCYEYRDSEFDPQTARLAGLAREENKMVYSKVNPELYKESEVLVYNYGAGVSETFSTYNLGYINIPAVDFDYVTINGKKRKRIFCYEDNAGDDIAVEGLGFLDTIMGNLIYVQPNNIACSDCYRAWLLTSSLEKPHFYICLIINCL